MVMIVIMIMIININILIINIVILIIMKMLVPPLEASMTNDPDPGDWLAARAVYFILPATSVNILDSAIYIFHSSHCIKVY